MMRYIALFANDRDSAASERVQKIKFLLTSQNAEQYGWLCLEMGPSCIVLYRPFYEINESINIVSNNILFDKYIVFGKIFRKKSSGGGSKIEKLPSNISNKVFSSNGQALSDEYWGSYIGLFFQQEGQSLMALRDPSGSNPCYYMQNSGINIIFSNIEDVSLLDIGNLSVDMEHLAAGLIQRYICQSDTGLVGIKKLLQGQYIKFSGDEIKTGFYWHPKNIIENVTVDDPHEAAEIVRHTVTSSVSSYLEGHNRAILKLSGGLDSNIVLAAARLARPDVEIICINHTFDDTAADEGRLAKIASKYHNVPLVSHVNKVEDFDYHRIELLRAVPEVTRSYFNIVVSRPEFDLYSAEKATIMLSGNGGDEVFFMSAEDWTAADYFFNKGLTIDFLSVALDAARLGRSSFYRTLWSSLAAKFGNRMKHRAYQRSPVKSVFINPELYENFDPSKYIHPWLVDLEYLPPGKYTQVYYITHPDYRRLAQLDNWHLNEASPLYSQIMFESVLPIPTYLLAEKGRDRGLARRSFDGLVPPEILWRESKAIGDSFAKKLLIHCQDFIREYLLDGLLVKNSLLLRTELEQALDPKTIDLKHASPEIILFIEQEAWLRKWTV